MFRRRFNEKRQKEYENYQMILAKIFIDYENRFYEYSLKLPCKYCNYQALQDYKYELNMMLYYSIAMKEHISKHSDEIPKALLDAWINVFNDVKNIINEYVFNTDTNLCKQVI